MHLSNINILYGGVYMFCISFFPINIVMNIYEIWKQCFLFCCSDFIIPGKHSSIDYT